MKRLFLPFVILLSLLAPSAWACDITNASIPESVRKQLELECVKAEETAKAEKQQGLVAPAFDKERISVYADVAMQVAKAIGVAAKETGVAVNEFIATPAGILTVGIILFKVFGNVFVLASFVVLVIYIAARIIHGMWTVDSGEDVIIKHPFGLNKVARKKRRLSYEEACESLVGWSVVVVAVALVSILLAVINLKI